MEIEECRKLANELISKHNLVGWVFRFDRSKQRLGCCHFNKKTITLSPYYVLLNNIVIVKDVILHEISHALVGVKQHHNSIWKSKCIEIGCSPERVCSNEVTRPKGRYIKTCPNCKLSFEVNRIRKNENKACKKCCNTYNNGKWDKRFVWMVSKNG